MCSDTQGAWLRLRNKHIPVTVHRVAIRLKQLELAATEHGCEGNVHLCVRELHTQAASRTFSKADHVARQVLAVRRFGGIEPTLRPEGEAIREQVFVVGEGEVGHGDHISRGEQVRLVPNGLCVRDAGTALGRTVG